MAFLKGSLDLSGTNRRHAIREQKNSMSKMKQEISKRKIRGNGGSLSSILPTKKKESFPLEIRENSTNPYKPWDIEKTADVSLYPLQPPCRKNGPPWAVLRFCNQI